jgi:hypothetical protein
MTAALTSGDKKYDLDKGAISATFSAVVSSTDPANSLHYTSALLWQVRALLLQMLTDRIPDPTRILIASKYVVKEMLVSLKESGVITPEEDPKLEKLMEETFKIESVARYGFELFRDINICDNLLEDWEIANRTYLERHDAWGISNTLLSRINTELFGIITRYDLKGTPKGGNWDFTSKTFQPTAAISEQHYDSHG